MRNILSSNDDKECVHYHNDKHIQKLYSFEKKQKTFHEKMECGVGLMTDRDVAEEGKKTR